MRITVATFEGMPDEFGWEDRLLLDEIRRLGAEVAYVPWTDAAADWDSPDLVFARSPWDYALRHAEFVEWVRRVGAPLENAPELIAWNSDKRYLGDLAGDGVPVVGTTYVGPGDPVPPIDAEVVVKPTVSGGARDTGRFGPGSAQLARELIERIRGRGDTAMVQPFVASVEEAGETAIVMIDGELSHVLRKAPVLRADEIAPLREDGLGVAEAMYDPGLVLAGSAEADQVELAEGTLDAVRRRFGTTPLVARVDMLREAAGRPVLLELEAIEPNLYFDHAPEAAGRLARAIVDRARPGAG